MEGICGLFEWLFIFSFWSTRAPWKMTHTEHVPNRNEIHVLYAVELKSNSFEINQKQINWHMDFQKQLFHCIVHTLTKCVCGTDGIDRLWKKSFILRENEF